MIASQWKKQQNVWFVGVWIEWLSAELILSAELMFLSSESYTEKTTSKRKYCYLRFVEVRQKDF